MKKIAFLIGVLLMLSACGEKDPMSTISDSMPEAVSESEIKSQLEESVEESSSKAEKIEVSEPSISSEELQASSVQSVQEPDGTPANSQVEQNDTDVIKVYAAPQGGYPKSIEDLETSDCFVVTVTHSALKAEFYESLDEWDKGSSLSKSCELTQTEAEELFVLAEKIADLGAFEYEEIDDDWDITIVYKGKLYTSNLDNEILQFWRKLKELAPIDLTLYGLG